VSAVFSQCLGDTVQTGARKVDPAWKLKCTTTASYYATSINNKGTVSEISSDTSCKDDNALIDLSDQV